MEGGLFSLPSRVTLLCLFLAVHVALHSYTRRSATSALVPACPAPVAILYTGQTHRWVEDAEAGLLQYALPPLLAAYPAVDFHICTDTPLPEEIENRLSTWPARVRVRVWAVGDSEQSRRPWDCALAMQEAGLDLAGYQYTLFVRLGLVLYSALPPLPPPHPGQVLHTRARLAANMPPGLQLFSAHFSWLHFDGRCVDGCEEGCSQAFGTEQQGLWVSDDALVLIPAPSLQAFLNHHFALLAGEPMAACFASFAVAPYWQWSYSMSEFKFTCAMRTQGVQFVPLAVNAQLSQHTPSNVQAELRVWGGRVPPEVWVAKNCTGRGAEG